MIVLCGVVSLTIASSILMKSMRRETIIIFFTFSLVTNSLVGFFDFDKADAGVFRVGMTGVRMVHFGHFVVPSFDFFGSGSCLDPQHLVVVRKGGPIAGEESG